MPLLTFTPSSTPINTPVTKFGGQPVWLTGPMWPLSRSTGKPMRFICQVQIPAALGVEVQRMAYVFLSDNGLDGTVEASWESQAGENAVILQPGPFDALVPVSAQAQGPTLLVRRETASLLDRLLGRKRITFESSEFCVRLIETDDPERGTCIGGEPAWLQADETPADGPWRFLMQIDSLCPDWFLNLGDAGMAYVFLSPDGLRARMLWQSH